MCPHHKVLYLSITFEHLPTGVTKINSEQQPHRRSNLSDCRVVRWGVLASDTPSYYRRLGNEAWPIRWWSRLAMWLAAVSEDVIACHRSILPRSELRKDQSANRLLHRTVADWARRLASAHQHGRNSLQLPVSTFVSVIVWISVDLLVFLCMTTWFCNIKLNARYNYPDT